MYAVHYKSVLNGMKRPSGDAIRSYYDSGLGGYVWPPSQLEEDEVSTPTPSFMVSNTSIEQVPSIFSLGGARFQVTCHVLSHLTNMLQGEEIFGVPV